jgi:hypothetical protein
VTKAAHRALQGRTSEELKRRALHDREFTVEQMRTSKKWAGRMKYALLLIPIVLIVLVLEVLAGDMSWLMTVAFVLVSYGAINSYRIGAVWEARWDELIRQRATPAD